MLKVQIFVIARKISVKSPTQFLIFALFEFSSCFFKTKKLLSKINDVSTSYQKLRRKKYNLVQIFDQFVERANLLPD